MPDPIHLHVGQKVAARNAFGVFRKAEVAPVPRSWRDRSGSETVTTRGKFPKCWLRFRHCGLPDCGPVVPWPIEDVFTRPEELVADR